jgi:hypothetical protein
MLFSGQNKSGQYSASTNLERGSSGVTDANHCINAFKAATSYIFGAGDTPALLDADGYPNGTITTSIGFNIIFANQTTNNGSTQWVLKWPSTRTIAVLHINNSISTVSASGCTVTNSGATRNVNGSAGNACRLVFTWGGDPGNLSFTFNPGSYGGSGEICLCRASDEAVYDAGGGSSYYMPEYAALLQKTQAKFYRAMGETHNGGTVTNLSRWNYRNTPASFSWQSTQFPPGAWGGTISGTDAYTVTAPTDAPASLTDGQVIQGTVTNASTVISISGAVSNGGNVQLTVNSSATLSPSQQIWVVFVVGTTEANGFQTILTVDDGTHITINVPFVHAYTSGGKIGTQTLTVSGTGYPVKFIADNTSVEPPTTAIAAGSNATFVYNSLAGLWVYTSGGITQSTPIEVLVARSNISDSGLWYTWPDMVDDDFVTRTVTYVRDNLSAGFWNELGNETWNNAFPQFFWAASRGRALGWSDGSAQSWWGWQGLRSRQIHGSAALIWTATRSRSTLHNVIAFQAFGSTSATKSNLLEGSQLNGATFPLYLAYVGGVDPGYNTAPNRPVDLADTISYAPYTGGANFLATDLGLYSTSNIGQATFLQNLVNLYETGLAADHATALALMDNDFRQGTLNTQTVTIGGGDTFTISGTNYSSGQRVVFTTTDTIFTGISLNTVYFVVSPSGSTFKVSLTSGGSAVTGISGGAGTQSVGALDRATIMGTASQVFMPWETVAASYDAARAGFTPTMPNLQVESYEGGWSPVAPTSVQCTTIGVTTPSAATASADLAQLLLDYKNSTQPNYGREMIRTQFRAFMGTQPAYPGFNALPHSATPCHFLLTGGGPYAMLPDNAFSTPFQTFYGFQIFPQ